MTCSWEMRLVSADRKILVISWTDLYTRGELKSILEHTTRVDGLQQKKTISEATVSTGQMKTGKRPGEPASEKFTWWNVAYIYIFNSVSTYITFGLAVYGCRRELIYNLVTIESGSFCSYFFMLYQKIFLTTLASVLLVRDLNLHLVSCKAVLW